MQAHAIIDDSPMSAVTETTSILIADAFSPQGIAHLESLGCRVLLDAALDGDALIDAIGEKQPDVVIVRSTKLPSEVFAAAETLSLVVRAGAGYDTIDVAAASARGISVANCPGMNAIAVAELAWGLILSCDRRIPDQTADLRNGVWAKKEYAKASGLFGRTLGIVGLGRIGQEIATRGRAFGMKVVAWSRSLTQERADAIGVGYCESLNNLAKMSDVVSVNVAALSDTAKLIDDAFFDAMKPGSTIVNTSRGSVIDHEALASAIQDKQIRAGLDVFQNEPKGGDQSFENGIVSKPGVYGTHHVGASTNQAQEAIASEAVRIVETWMNSGEVPNCVNIASSTAASTLLTIRHLNQPGVLAHVFEILGSSKTNVEEMENVVYEGATAACARIQISGTLGTTDLEHINDHSAVLSVSTSPITAS
ncbi:MAG: 3-phosphoglycerate dehydrogenase family protein [Phycisphaerales bacterium]|nr:3-phosphoglycerate dehydrogenase family protein [Phycisphaerales bacterium]